jgi:hypoxanthine phosphoribosyltransferase
MSERLVTMLSTEQIAARVKELGAQIAAEYKDRNLVLVVVLKGSFIFAADLCRAIDGHVRIDFLGVRSYGEGTETSGVVQITQDLSRPIAGEDVLIVEDIVDTGLTIAHLMDLFRTRNPRSVKVCSLLHKPARARVAVNVDFLGFTIEDKFVVGYGLDYAEQYRNLPYIAVLE